MGGTAVARPSGKSVKQAGQTVEKSMSFDEAMVLATDQAVGPQVGAGTFVSPPINMKGFRTITFYIRSVLATTSYPQFSPDYDPSVPTNSKWFDPQTIADAAILCAQAATESNCITLDGFRAMGARIVITAAANTTVSVWAVVGA